MEASPALTIMVQLMPGMPELAVTLEAPAGGATVRWVKEELCRQDPTGEATPADFRLCAVGMLRRALADGQLVTAELGSLTVLTEEEVDAEEDEARAAPGAAGAAAAGSAGAQAEEDAMEEARAKAKAFFAERKAKEEAEQRAREEAESREGAEEAKQRAEEEAKRQAKEEAERWAREEADRSAQREAADRAKAEAEERARAEAAQQEAEAKRAAEEAQQAAEEVEARARRDPNLLATKEAVLQRGRDKAREGVVPGLAKIQVSFKFKGQSWIHGFEVERGCVVLDLKEKMMAKAPEEAAWFELQKLGRRIGDLEPIRNDETFAFCFLGAEQGELLAAKDMQRKAAELSALAAAAVKQMQCNEEVQLEVLLKRGVWEERRVSVTLRAEATVKELREAVAKSIGEEAARVCLFEDADTPEAMEDDERIGVRQEFRARCAAPEGHQATPAELWQAADDLKWFAWHEVWAAAYSGQAAKLAGAQRMDLLHKAEGDTGMSSKHQQAIEESKAVPARLLRRLRQAAEAAGQAASAAQDVGALDPQELRAFDPPRDTDEGLWTSMTDALNIAAAEVTRMLKDTSRPTKISETEFHPAWQKVVGRLCGSVTGRSKQQGPPATIPLVLGTELKWFIWNGLWEADNEEYGNGSYGPKRAEKLGKSKEDAKRALGHFQALEAMGNFSAETLERIKECVQAAGSAAGKAALQEKSLLPQDIEATSPPSEQEISPDFWSGLADAVFKCAAAVAEMTVEGLHKFMAGRMLQTEFEIAIRRLCEPPFVDQAPESNEQMQPMLGASQLERPPAHAVEAYERDWIAGPLTAMDKSGVRACNDELVRFLKRDLQGQWERMFNAHVLCPWVHQLACNPRIVGAVASVLKTDTVMLHSSVVVPCDPNKVGLDEGDGRWHADCQPLMEHLGPLQGFVTVMLALSPCARASGCAEFVMGPGSPTRKLELQPGEFSLSHPSVYYKMNRNGAKTRRDMILLRYMGGSMRDTYVELREGEQRDLVLLVSGQDLTGNFRLLEPPLKGFGSEELARWDELKHCRMRRFKRLI